MRIPLVGYHLNLWFIVFFSLATVYEDVADMLAADLESGTEEWVGMMVGMCDKAKLKMA